MVFGEDECVEIEDEERNLEMKRKRKWHKMRGARVLSNLFYIQGNIRE